MIFQQGVWGITCNYNFSLPMILTQKKRKKRPRNQRSIKSRALKSRAAREKKRARDRVEVADLPDNGAVLVGALLAAARADGGERLRTLAPHRAGWPQHRRRGGLPIAAGAPLPPHRQGPGQALQQRRDLPHFSPSTTSSQLLRRASATSALSCSDVDWLVEARVVQVPPRNRGRRWLIGL